MASTKRKADFETAEEVYETRESTAGIHISDPERTVSAEEINQEEGVDAVVERKNPERLIYMGPNLPGGRLLSGQVFKGGYPPHLEQLFKETPEVKQLFFPVDKAMEALKKLKEPGSNEARLFFVVKNKGVK